MKSRRIWLLVLALLVAALFGGLVTQEAPAQQQTYLVDGISFLPRSADIGIDAWVVARVTILSAPSPGDTLTATVSSPDPNVLPNSLEIDMAAFFPPLQAGDTFVFAVQQVSFVPGNFSLFVSSALEGTVLPLTSFPAAPNYDVTVGISTLTGEVGSQFSVTTTIDVGDMSEIQTRFDIEYVLDGVAQRQSEVVSLRGRELFSLAAPGFVVPFTQNPDYRTWHATQAFTLAPGNHTLVVNVVDQSIAQQVFSTSFTIRVTDQIQAVETRLDELTLDVGELEGRAENVELASATATSLSYLAIAALGLSVLTLLIQFGILKLGRFRRGPLEPQKPQE